jgi:hypothetical protein
LKISRKNILNIAAQFSITKKSTMYGNQPATRRQLMALASQSRQEMSQFDGDAYGSIADAKLNNFAGPALAPSSSTVFGMQEVEFSVSNAALSVQEFYISPSALLIAGDLGVGANALKPNDTFQSIADQPLKLVAFSTMSLGTLTRALSVGSVVLGAVKANSTTTAVSTTVVKQYLIDYSTITQKNGGVPYKMLSSVSANSFNEKIVDVNLAGKGVILGPAQQVVLQVPPALDDTTPSVTTFFLVFGYGTNIADRATQIVSR